jgi:hypothetical protein
MTDDPALALLQGSPLLENAFGVLRFDGTEKYFALDGQHRLKAIRELTEPDSPSYLNRPPGFENEEISVVLVVPGEVEDTKEFRRRFRRLFGHLNRYAKPMDLATIIGLVVGFGAVIGGQILEGGHLSALIQPTAAIIVLGGTIGATFVSFPLENIIQAVKDVKKALFVSPVNHDTLIKNLMGYAAKARKNGLISLEPEVQNIKDRFLKNNIKSCSRLIY